MCQPERSEHDDDDEKEQKKSGIHERARHNVMMWLLISRKFIEMLCHVAGECDAATALIKEAIQREQREE
jgi:hypothetical protein